MKESKYSDAQILSILMQAENGVPVADLCRALAMSMATKTGTSRAIIILVIVGLFYGVVCAKLL